MAADWTTQALSGIGEFEVVDARAAAVTARVVEAFPRVLRPGDRAVALYFYDCQLRGAPRPVLGQQMRWVPRGELATLGFPPADVELIRVLTESAAR